jgi:hypothetical protein
MTQGVEFFLVMVLIAMAMSAHGRHFCWICAITALAIVLFFLGGERHHHNHWD